jgi:hypothetical protein
MKFYSKKINKDFSKKMAMLNMFRNKKILFLSGLGTLVGVGVLVK